MREPRPANAGFPIDPQASTKGNRDHQELGGPEGNPPSFGPPGTPRPFSPRVCTLLNPIPAQSQIDTIRVMSYLGILATFKGEKK
jgi:hypothetical protein